MKEIKIIILILAFTVISCNKGLWIDKYSYRPLKPKFEILKEEFVKNEFVNNDYIYISTKKFVDYNGNKHISYLGFYEDGRMIMDGYIEDKTKNILSKRNSFKTAYSIGYYTTTNNTITTECFVEGDRGIYLKNKGIIKKDTIIINEVINFLYKKETRSDTLIKSNYKLME